MREMSLKKKELDLMITQSPTNLKTLEKEGLIVNAQDTTCRREMSRI